MLCEATESFVGSSTEGLQDHTAQYGSRGEWLNNNRRRCKEDLLNIHTTSACPFILVPPTAWISQTFVATLDWFVPDLIVDGLSINTSVSSHKDI